MKKTRWNPLKSERLKKTRGVSFEEIIKGEIINKENHPIHKHQKIMLINYKGYIWLVPYVETETEIFLKTLYPSRKYTKIYRKGTSNEKN